MAQASATYHEDKSDLDPKTIEMHRALVSIQEELEAIDWYAQRRDASGDAEQRAILEHNREEEIEHACMLLEWLRRNDPKFDENMRTYLFTDKPILEVEEQEEHDGGGDGSLGLGSLRPGRTS